MPTHLTSPCPQIDGYTSPVTAGNFVDLVNKGFYDGMRIQRSDGFVVQTGDPSKEGRGDGKINGYVPEGKEKVCPYPLTPTPTPKPKPNPLPQPPPRKRNPTPEQP